MCAQQIYWLEPEQDTITKVEISRSTTAYGSYAVLEEINATSDGLAKTAANTWVTTYTDTAGTRTNWYKTRFYDGTSLLYSEYSDPITSEELIRLCTTDEVKKAVDTVGRWTDDEIFDIITEVDENIYTEMGTPIKAIYSDVTYNDTTSTTYKNFYLGEQNVYRVDRLFVGTTTMTELFIDDEYKTNLKYGMIKILPYASSGFVFDRKHEVEVHFVPKIYNRLAIYRTVKMLLEQIDTISGGSSSKELATIERRLAGIERILGDHLGIVMSSDYANYDPIYGQNKKKLTQDYDRNIYLGTYGFE